MGQLADAKHAALLTLTASASGDIQDLERQHLLSVVAAPKGNSIQDLWVQYLVELGYTGTLQDMLFDYLIDINCSGSLQDMLLQMWLAGGPALNAATYADLATAESGVRNWANGAVITITGLANLQFLFLNALRVSGHSGLVHRYPFSDATTLSSAALNTAYPANTDPDDMIAADWVDGSTGVKSTDYELDTNGGLARLRNLTGSGAVDIKYGTNPASGELFAATILDNVSLTTSEPSSVAASIMLPVYHNGTVAKALNVRAYLTASATNWTLYSGVSSVDSTIAFGTAARLWLYANATNGLMSIWGDAFTAAITNGIFTAGSNFGQRMIHNVVGQSTTTLYGYLVNAVLS